MTGPVSMGTNCPRDMDSTTRASGSTLYGDRASLSIARAKPTGTMVKLRVPFREIVMDSEVR